MTATTYAGAALHKELSRVAQTPAGAGRNVALNRAAFSLGTLVATGALDRNVIQQRLEDAALASGLTADIGIGGVRATIRSGLRAGLRSPRKLDDIHRRRPPASGVPWEAPRPVAPPAPEPPPPFVNLSSAGRSVWRRTRRITPDDPAGRYLLARRCSLPHPDGDLRWHPELRHPDGYTGSALIGLVTDALDARRALNLHRTWVAGDGSGRKAELDRPRLLLWRHRKAGGVIRLWPDCEVALSLGVAEGIETALSLAHVHRPVWALIDAGNLATFPCLYPLEHLTVAVDHDPAGMKAAEALGERWQREADTSADEPIPDRVKFILPREKGLDLNDCAVSGAAWEATNQEACRRLGLSRFGSSARVREAS